MRFSAKFGAWVIVFLYHLLLIPICLASDGSTSSPLSVPPSQYWDGDDGPWSSFAVQVGTPPQSLRLFPATDQSTTWVVLPDGCTPIDVDCPKSRGFSFVVNGSTTWLEQGNFTTALTEESLLGYEVNASYGFDTVTLGWQGDGLPSEQHQVITAFDSQEFYIGNLGINPRPFNFSTLNDPQPSLLGSLRNASKIPSSTWAYTAGAFNLNPPVYGSLTLGGYDKSRFNRNNLTIPMGPDISRDLLIAIKSITANTTNTPLIQSPIYAFIDSLVPHIWLPTSACEAFENAFNLTYDNGTGYYWVDESLHAELQTTNPTIVFTIGASTSSSPSESVNITMPYSSFDLTASAPLLQNATRYFPLRRADNASQYTLGRTFLQNAYLIADYDRSTFFISQALFPNSSTPQDLIAIFPPDSKSGSHVIISTPVIIGVAIGGAAVICLVTAMFLILNRRNKRMAQKRPQTPLTHAMFAKAELDTFDTTKPNTYGESGAMELDPTTERQELQTHDKGKTKSGVFEMHTPSSDPMGHEMQTSADETVYEMPGEELQWPELPERRSARWSWVQTPQALRGEGRVERSRFSWVDTPNTLVNEDNGERLIEGKSNSLNERDRERRARFSWTKTPVDKTGQR